MFSKILVPLDGSALSEKALAMAQHLASPSDTSLHLMQVISLQPELEASHGIGGESITILEMAQDAARQLIEVRYWPEGGISRPLVGFLLLPLGIRFYRWLRL